MHFVGESVLVAITTNKEVRVIYTSWFLPGEFHQTILKKQADEELRSRKTVKATGAKASIQIGDP